MNLVCLYLCEDGSPGSEFPGQLERLRSEHSCPDPQPHSHPAEVGPGPRIKGAGAGARAEDGNPGRHPFR